MKVAQYEVLGRFFQKRPIPQAQGTIDWLLALARPYASQGQRVRSSLPEGAIFYAFPTTVVGCYQMSLRDRRAAPAEHPLPGTILTIDQQKRRP